MLGTTSIDDLEATVLGAESAISTLRAIQLGALRRLDDAGVANIDGARSLVEWTSAKLDLAPENAQALVQASRIVTSDDSGRLGRGECSFDRALATSRLAAAGADESDVSMAAGCDIAGVRRLTARQRRFTRRDQQRVFADQHVVLQPNLDESAYSIRGLLDGVGGRSVEKALQQRSDEFPEDVRSRAHRYALSLTSICQDSLGDSVTGEGGGADVVLFADLDRMAVVGRLGLRSSSAPGSGRRYSRRRCVPGRYSSSAWTTANRWLPPITPKLSRLLSAALSCGGTVAAPSRGAGRGTGSRFITSNIAATAVATIRTI